MLLTKEEAQHWARWHRQTGAEMVSTDEFWNSLFEAYKGKNVPLPLLPDTQTVWKVLKRFKCDPNCGKCCHYKQVLVTPYDIKRMMDAKLELTKCLQMVEGGSVNLIAAPDCPFLKDNACSIYDYRPETCFLFPLQCGDPQQLSIRLLCKPALELARKIVTGTMNEGGKILLPDLTIIAG